MGLICALRNAAPELIAELRELRRDKERLDWLARHATDGLDLSHRRTVIMTPGSLVGNGLREAIDAAMEQAAVEDKEKPNAE